MNNSKNINIKNININKLKNNIKRHGDTLTDKIKEIFKYIYLPKSNSNNKNTNYGFRPMYLTLEQKKDLKLYIQFYEGIKRANINMSSYYTFTDEDVMYYNLAIEIFSKANKTKKNHLEFMHNPSIKKPNEIRYNNSLEDPN